jgi:hypothetical protein
MADPGSDIPSSGQQPRSPDGAWVPSQGAPQARPEQKNNTTKWLSIAGADLTEDEFMADPASCSEFETAEAAFWSAGGMLTDKGTVYCAASL